MTTDQSPDDFFEEDEPVEQIIAAFERGPHFITAPPAAGQTAESPNFRAFTRSFLGIVVVGTNDALFGIARAASKDDLTVATQA